MNTVENDFDRAMAVTVIVSLLSAVLLGGFGGGFLRGLHIEIESYHQKLAFCHARMQSNQTLILWREQYCQCGKKSSKRLDAVDPISV